MSQVTLSVLVDESDVRDLLIELAEDKRVRAVNAETGDGKYLVPVPAHEQVGT